MKIKSDIFQGNLSDDFIKASDKFVLKSNITTKNNRKDNNNFRKFLIFAIVALAGTVAYNALKKPTADNARELKKQKEIERIKQKSVKEKYNYDNSCEVYALVARSDGWFPCYNCGLRLRIFLYEGEVWKYGKTCIGQERRYTNLEEKNLLFQRIFSGTEQDCLIREKELIYSYRALPECLKRKIKLIRPPGNKIDR